jgi:HK97 family phage prohead protease
MSGADLERRASVELRAAGRKLIGTAAVFNTPAQIGGFTESIRPGAFRASLASGADVRALVDHDDSKLLGRTRSGTLRLAETDKGLAFELDVPDTTLGRDVLHMAERGDLSGCSFGFAVPDGGDAWPNHSTRELRSVTLHEISILHRLPAYDATTVAARARVMGRACATARLRTLCLAVL